MPINKGFYSLFKPPQGNLLWRIEHASVSIESGLVALWRFDPRFGSAERKTPMNKAQTAHPEPTDDDLRAEFEERAAILSLSAARGWFDLPALGART